MNRKAYVLMILILLCSCNLNTRQVLADNDIKTTWLVNDQINTQIHIANEGRVEEATKELHKLFYKYADKPQGKAILNALGTIYERISPRKALIYYQKAVNHKVASDIWNLEEQHALQNLSRVYANLGNYKQAIVTLSKWRINEPCGTGTAYSEYQKATRLWELRLHCETPDRVFMFMWNEMESGSLILDGVGPDIWALSLRSLASPKYIHLLESTAKVMRARLSSCLQDRRKYMISNIANCILSQDDYCRDINGYNLQQLVSELERLDARCNLHGSPYRLYDKEISSLWQEELVIARLYHLGAVALPLLIESNERNYNILAMYTIGVIGGNNAVSYLISKANAEENQWCLIDYYFCMLNTHDYAAKKIVENTARGKADNNNRTAALDALKMKLPDKTKLSVIADKLNNEAR